MSDPTLAALTEALLDYTPLLPGPRFPLIDGEAQEVAAAILAHPAMADLARKAVALDEFSIAYGLHVTAGRNHNLGEGPMRAVCASIESHLPRARALIEAAALAVASPEDER